MSRQVDLGAQGAGHQLDVLRHIADVVAQFADVDRAGAVGDLRGVVPQLVAALKDTPRAPAPMLDAFMRDGQAELDELAAEATLWLVEWPERGAGSLPPPDLSLALAADGAGTIAGTTSSAKPWPGAGGVLLFLDLGLDAVVGGAGEACRTVEATLASRTVVATDADLEGYRMVGAMLGSRTVATLPALDGFLTVAATLGSRTVAALAALEGFRTVAARLGSLGAPFDLERADAGRAASDGAGFLSIDLPLLGMGAAFAGGGRGGGGAKGADAAAAAAAGCTRGPAGPVGGAAGTGT